MIEFKNSPPTCLEDVNLSEIGRHLLSAGASKMNAGAYGESALSEIIEEFGDQATLDEIKPYIYRINQQADEAISTEDPRRMIPTNPFDLSATSHAFRVGIGIDNGQRGLIREAINSLLDISKNQEAVTV